MRKLLLTAVLALAALPAMSLPFVENDYSKALARARTNRIPLFVDVWAPW